MPISSIGNLHGDFPSIEAEMPDFIENLTHWLVSRQTQDKQEQVRFEFADDEAADLPREGLPKVFEIQGTAFTPPGSCTPSSEMNLDELPWAGFNGRCNKESDTCYSFWVGGSLAAGLPQPGYTMAQLG